MALNKAPTFEEMDDTDLAAQAAAVEESAQARKSADKPQTEVLDSDGQVLATMMPDDEAVAQRALATASVSTAVSTAVKPAAIKNQLAEMKNVFEVDWDSLPRISAESGSFVFKDDSALNLGDEIEIRLLSFQDNYVCHTGNINDDIKHVKWSRDGKVSDDGTNMLAWLEHLKSQNFKDARIDHRLVVVAELLTVKGGQTNERCEELVQFDFPVTARKSFNTHNLQISYKIDRKKMREEDRYFMKLKAVPARNADNKSYTKINVSVGTPRE